MPEQLPKPAGKSPRPKEFNRTAAFERMNFQLRSSDGFATFVLYLGSPRFGLNGRALPALSGF
jgi:hypothetical protein